MEIKEKEKKPEEKPIVTIKPKPEPEAPSTTKQEVSPKPPPKPKPAMSKIAQETYNYLKKHGASTPLQIARDLNLDTFTVMKALKELRNLGTVKLSIYSE